MKEKIMNLKLEGKTAIVTGGSAGIGFVITKMLAEEGVAVSVPGRSLAKVNEAIAGLSGKVRAIEADLGTLVTYLASPLAANTNGAALRCEGGILRTIF